MNSLNEEIVWLIEGILENGNLSCSYDCGMPGFEFTLEPHRATRYKDQGNDLRKRLRELHMKGVPCIPVQHAFERVV